MSEGDPQNCILCIASTAIEQAQKVQFIRCEWCVQTETSLQDNIEFSFRIVFLHFHTSSIWQTLSPKLTLRSHDFTITWTTFYATLYYCQC